MHKPLIKNLLLTSFVAAIALLCGVAPTSASAERFYVDEQSYDTSQPINLKQDDLLEVRLRDISASAGYAWSVSHIPSFMTKRSETLIPPKGHMIGAPGTHIFEFARSSDCMLPGETLTDTIDFKQARPWESFSSRIFSVYVATAPTPAVCF